MNKISISGIKEKESVESFNCESNYKDWVSFRKESQTSYIILPSDLKNNLKCFEKRSISLYLFYCFSANNKTGNSYFPIETIADILNVTTKTITTWNNDLIKLGLINRKQNRKKSTDTFLLPITDFIAKREKQTLEEYIKEYKDNKENIDLNVGEIEGIYHIFQWRKGDNKEYNKPFSQICIVHKRKIFYDNDVFKFVLLTEKKLESIVVNSKSEKDSDDVKKIECAEFNEVISSIGIKDIDNFSVLLKTNYDLDKIHSNKTGEEKIKLIDVFKEIHNQRKDIMLLEEEESK